VSAPAERGRRKRVKRLAAVSAMRSALHELNVDPQDMEDREVEAHIQLLRDAAQKLVWRCALKDRPKDWQSPLLMPVPKRWYSPQPPEWHSELFESDRCGRRMRSSANYAVAEVEYLATFGSKATEERLTLCPRCFDAMMGRHYPELRKH
jgi:hypothetical protein